MRPNRHRCPQVLRSASFRWYLLADLGSGDQDANSFSIPSGVSGLDFRGLGFKDEPTLIPNLPEPTLQGPYEFHIRVSNKSPPKRGFW